MKSVMKAVLQEQPDEDIAQALEDGWLPIREVARQTGALLMGSGSTLMVGQGWGLPPDRMKLAQLHTPYRFGRFTVTLYPALHTPTGFTGGVIEQPLKPPVRATDYLEGQSYAMHIAHEAAP